MGAEGDRALDGAEEGSPDPLGGGAIAAITDVVLIAFGVAGLLAPFLALFVASSLRGQDSLPVLAIGAVLALAAPAVLVARFGSPSDVIRRRAGVSDIRAPDIQPAPLPRRVLAGVLDAVVLSGTSIALVVPLFLTLATFGALFPIGLVPLAVLLTSWIALYARGYRPGARLPSPGLTVCGLARVRGAEGVHTVRASALPTSPRAGVRRLGLLVAWFGILVAVPVVAFFVLWLMQAVVDALG